MSKLDMDKELLGFALKAAGWQAEWFEHEQCYVIGDSKWDPLNSSADALNLSARLKINIEYGEDMIWAKTDDNEYVCEIYIYHDGDEIPAVCKAIVRAAAEIGKLI